jgi:ATP-dependent protease ClpP protease subunit
MGTAYLYFGKPITSDTITALVMGCRSLMGEKDQNGILLWDHFHLEIASGGGDIIASFAGYNTLVNLPVTVTTHNAGAVDSSALMLFLAGEKRTASRMSRFFFHQIQWSFSAQGSLTAGMIEDAGKWLSAYEDLMAECIADETNISKDDAMKMMREGTSVSPEEAETLGLIDEIKASPVPATARSWQV